MADKMERMILSGDSLQKMTAVQTAAPEGADLSGILMRALPYVWAAAALLLSGILAVLYIRECRRMNEAIPLSGEQACSLRKEADIPERVRLLASDRIVTPVVFGIGRPKIILPSFLLSEKSGRLKFVLAHEAAHVRRGDNLWKVIMLLAVCIHWFNPLVWLMYVLFSRDMELSCDERVLSRFGEGAKREYARALVGLAEKQYQRSLFAQGFGKSAIKERIEAIMKFKKATGLSAACAVLLLGTAVTVFAQTDQREIGIQDNDIAAVQEENDVNSGDAAQAEAPAGNSEESMEIDLGLIDSFVNSEEFQEYEAYGVSYDSASGELMYDGERAGFLYIMEENGGEIQMAVSHDERI